MNAVEVRQLTKAFGSRKALDNVTFALPEGAFLSVFGSNGAGKTTLVRVLATLAHPSAGSVRIAGIDPHEHADDVRSRIGMVSHAPMLYPDLTAEENLAFYAELYGVVDPRARARKLLDDVGLSMRRFDAVRTFSRGMVQRASIARALVHDPDLVLLDEPYSGLDPHAVDVFDGIIAAEREKRAFVMVSHDLEKGLSLATHALVLSCGRVVAFAPTAGIDRDAFAQTYRDTVGMGVA